MEPSEENAESLLPLVLRGEAAAAERLVELLYPVVIRIVRNHLPGAWTSKTWRKRSS